MLKFTNKNQIKFPSQTSLFNTALYNIVSIPHFLVQFQANCFQLRIKKDFPKITSTIQQCKKKFHLSHTIAKQGTVWHKTITLNSEPRDLCYALCFMLQLQQLMSETTKYFFNFIPLWHITKFYHLHTEHPNHPNVINFLCMFVLYATTTVLIQMKFRMEMVTVAPFFIQDFYAFSAESSPDQAFRMPANWLFF